MRSWMARVSLLGRFTVMGLVVVAALGLAIGLTLRHHNAERAHEHAVSNARVIAQGYHIARPLPAAELDAWLVSRV